MKLKNILFTVEVFLLLSRILVSKVEKAGDFMLKKILFFIIAIFMMQSNFINHDVYANGFYSYHYYFDNGNNTFIKCMDSEYNRNVRMENLIKKELDIPPSIMRKTDFYYNYIDLNNDGDNEIFVLVVGPYTSGSGGSTAFILEEKRHRLSIKQKFTLVNVPIVISESMTNGYRDIIVRNFGGGVKGRYIVLAYQDGAYTDVNSGYEITDLKDVSGVAILCDK